MAVPIFLIFWPGAIVKFALFDYFAKTMTSFRIRPRFSITSPKSQAQILEEVRARLKETNAEYRGIALDGHIMLKVKQADEHYWSPQLSILLDDQADQTLIRGRYGPKPNVWTLFTMSYLAISILTIFISIIGFSRLSLGLSANILWVLPVLAGAALLLYFSSQVGQKIGAEQTFALHHFFEEAIGQKIHIH